MPNFPGSVTTFTTVNPGDQIPSAGWNTITGEINAIEAGLINGTAPVTCSNASVHNLNASGASTLAGVLTLSTGQIAFPASQNASTNVNTLDDYEEGTFTPSLSFGGAAVGFTANNAGHYIKIGKMVWVNGYVSITAKGSSTGAARITGLPFTSMNVTGLEGNAGVLGIFWTSYSTTFVSVMGTVESSTTTAQILGATAAAASLVSLSETAFQVGSATYFAGSYQADA